MKKFKTAVVTLAVVGSLLAGSVAADAAPGKGKGSSSKSSKSNSSHVQKNSPKAVKETGAKKIVTKENVKEKTKPAVKMHAKKEAKNFKDTHKHWAEGPIQRLQMMGIVSGFPDDSFQPEEPVTQAQVIAMVMSTLELQEEQVTGETAAEETNTEEQSNLDEQTNEEVDTPETEEELTEVPAWAKGVVGKAKQKGIVNINRFHSHVQASRIQSMVWVAKAMGIEPADTSNIPFKDGILVSPEDVGYVMALYNEGIVKGGPGGYLNPNSSITRAQIAAIIDRLLTEQEQETDSSEVDPADESTSTDTAETGTDATDEDSINDSNDTTDTTDTTDGDNTSADDTTDNTTNTETTEAENSDDNTTPENSADENTTVEESTVTE